MNPTLVTHLEELAGELKENLHALAKIRDNLRVMDDIEKELKEQLQAVENGLGILRSVEFPPTDGAQVIARQIRTTTRRRIGAKTAARWARWRKAGGRASYRGGKRRFLIP